MRQNQLFKFKQTFILSISIYNYLALIIFVVLMTSCSGNRDISFENGFYNLMLNGKTGSIKSIEKNGKNLINSFDSEGPLFSIRFRDALQKGEIHEFNALHAQDCKIDSKEDLIVKAIFKTYIPVAGTRCH